jgi:hypothetical protein
LDRADAPHLGLGGMIATVLLISLLLRTLAAAHGWSIAARFAAALLAAFLTVRAWPQLDPRAAAAHVSDLRGALAKDDQVVSARLRSVVAAMRPTVARQRCFYTLDSNGMWYYFFDRRSCSRFHQVNYARTREAQFEVIDALDRERPDVLLFRDPDSAAHDDGPANGEQLVYSYVLREYRPMALVGGRWFWRRAGTPLVMRDRTAPGEIAVTAEAPPGTVRVTGTAAVPAGAQWAYVTVGNAPVEITPLRALDRGRAGFDVLAPVGFLRPGSWSIGVAVHDPRTDELVRVCSNC